MRSWTILKRRSRLRCDIDPRPLNTNYSMPGVLKNAIDCASRPYGTMLGRQARGDHGRVHRMLGTGRAQYHLRQTCVFLNMFPVNRPEVIVPFVTDKVDKDGRLTDEKTRAKVKELLESLIAWTKQLKGIK